jgi:mycothiol synthase
VWRLETRLDLAPSERDAVMRLVNEVAEHDGIEPMSDHLWLDLVHGGRPGFAAVLATADDGSLAGYVQLGQAHESWAIELLLHPLHRRHVPDLGEELLRAALTVVAGRGGGHLQWRVFHADEHADRLAAAVGLTPGRVLLQMRRALPLDLPQRAGTTVPTRPFEVGHDEAAWLEVNNAAFHWHPEQGGWDLATLCQREQEPWFDPQGFLLHERDGRLAAFCWTKVHHDLDPPVGEIYVIAVHPDFHGLGLGRALTVAGLQSLTARGVTQGMLYVDGDNTAAVTLYEHLGFTVHHADRAYVGDIEPDRHPEGTDR